MEGQLAIARSQNVSSYIVTALPLEWVAVLIATVLIAQTMKIMKKGKWQWTLFLTVIHKPLSLKSNKRKAIIKKVVIAKSQTALRSTVNATRVEWLALTFALAKVARIAKIGLSIAMEIKHLKKKSIKWRLMKKR
jgi:hypothetical protein